MIKPKEEGYYKVTALCRSGYPYKTDAKWTGYWWQDMYGRWIPNVKKWVGKK